MIIFFLLIAIILMMILLLALYNHNVNAKVVTNSPKISLLLSLNQSIGFHEIRDAFEISKHYDNKSSFNKIEPAYIMTAEMRENIKFYSEYVGKIQDNRSKKQLYQKKVEEILNTEDLVNYEEIKMSERSFLRREKRLFHKNMLFPVVECTYKVFMTYSSPKGKVNLSKNDVFDFEEMFACLESISRTRLDRNTYSQLALVERGEVSDSLRYDILNRDNFTCVICGASARQGARLHVDHILPIAKGGKSTPENLRTLCERCNIGKSDKIEIVNFSEYNDPNDSVQVEKKQEVCEICGAPLVSRKGKYGSFYGCSNFPKCRFTKKEE